MGNLWIIYGQSMDNLWTIYGKYNNVTKTCREFMKVVVEKCWELLMGWYDLCHVCSHRVLKELAHPPLYIRFLVQHGNAGFGFHIVLSLFIVSKQMVSEPQLCKYLIVHLWFSDSQAYQPPSQDFIYVVFFESRPKQWPSPMSLSAKWPTSTM